MKKIRMFGLGMVILLLFIPFVYGAYNQYHWSCDENSGNVCTEDTGNGDIIFYDASGANDTTFKAGVFNNWVYTDLTYGNGGVLNSSPEATICFWMNITTNEVWRFNGLSTSDNDLDFLQIFGDGGNTIHVNSRTAGGGSDTGGAITHNIGETYHYCIACDGSRVNVYQNGTNIDNFSSGECVDDWDADIEVALFSNAGAVSNADGWTDEVYYFNFNVTAHNVTSLMWNNTLQGGGVPPPIANLSIIAQTYEGIQLKTFNVSIDGIGEFTTTTGTILTNISINTTILYNITINAHDVDINITEVFIGWNVSIDLYFNFTLLDVHLVDAFTSLNISTFNSSLNAMYANTTVNNAYYYLSPGTYTVFTYVEGYNIANASIAASYGLSDLNISTYPFNSINLFFYNLSSLDLISGVNKTITIINATTFSQVNITEESTILLYGFAPDVYTFTISSEGFLDSTYIITIGNNTFQNLNVYLEDDGQDSVIFKFRDFNTAEIIEGGILNIEKFVNGSYLLIQSLTTDISGSVQVNYEETGNYRFTASASNFTSKTFILNPIIFATYTINLIPLSTNINQGDYSGVSIVINPTSYINNIFNNITFTIAAPTGNLGFYGFSARFSGDNTNVVKNGVNAYGSTLTASLNITNAATFDYVVFDFYYLTTTGILKNYTTIYDIRKTAVGTTTFLAIADNTYGITLFDRIMIMTITLILIGGVAFYFGGLVASGLLSILVFGYFAAISFIPLWITLPSIIVMSIMIMGRGTA